VPYSRGCGGVRVPDAHSGRTATCDECHKTAAAGRTKEGRYHDGERVRLRGAGPSAARAASKVRCCGRVPAGFFLLVWLDHLNSLLILPPRISSSVRISSSMLVARSSSPCSLSCFYPVFCCELSLRTANQERRSSVICGNVRVLFAIENGCSKAGMSLEAWLTHTLSAPTASGGVLFSRVAGSSPPDPLPRQHHFLLSEGNTSVVFCCKMQSMYK